MLSCRARSDIAIPDYWWLFFITEEYFVSIYAASLGTAARSRTMATPILMVIEELAPPLVAQQTFDCSQAEATALKARHVAFHQANGVLLPVALEQPLTGTL